MKRKAGTQIVMRPEAAYLAVVNAREARDGAAEGLVAACHARFAAERDLASQTEAAVVGLLNASRPLA